MQKILGQLAVEIKIRPEQVQAAVSLLDGGATVPFIARYRKEVTGNLDDIQLRELEVRLSYLRELEERRREADRLDVQFATWYYAALGRGESHEDALAAAAVVRAMK